MIKSIFFLQTFLLALLPTQIPSFNLSLVFPYAIEKQNLNDYQAFSCSMPHLEAPTAFCDHEVKTKIGKFTELSEDVKNLIAEDNEYRIKTVVIDPGHGGKDAGCRGAHSREKHIALEIAKKLGTTIEVAYPTIRVIYTRTVDKFVPLHQRAAIANRNKADLFISIHCNYISKASYVNGSETYVMGLHTANENLEVAKRENASILLEENYQKHYDYDPNSTEGHIMLSMFQNAFLEQSILFAEKVENHIHHDANRKSRGVKQAGFLVLRETTMPSVLIEAGFLSNAKEEGFLRQHAGQQQMANAIFNAFRAYKNEVEEKPRFAVQAVQPRTYANVSPSTPVQEFRPHPKVKSSAPIKEFEQKKVPNTPNKKQTLSTGNKQITINIPVSEPKTNTSSVQSYSYTTPPQTAPNTHHSTYSSPSKSTSSFDFVPKAYDAPSSQQKVIANTPKATKIPKTYKDPFVSVGSSASQMIQYCLQLAASPKPLNLRKGRWRNVPYLVQVVHEGGYYKYQIRNFANLEEATKLQATLKTKGFKDSFIVAYKGGNKVSLTQAKRALGR